MSLLLTCQILGLLVHTLATDEKYRVLNRDNLMIPIQMHLSEKKKLFLNFLLHFWNLTEILNVLKQKMNLIAFVFPKFRTRKRWLDKCLKTPVSEDSSTSKRVNVFKHCWNLHQSTFTIFIDHCLENWVGKTLPFWHAKPWDCLLTHWLPMKIILFFIGTFNDTNSGAIISETKRFFSVFCWIFEI